MTLFVRNDANDFYYVDATGGDDANAGTWAKPWKTLAKVNAATFAPGDMILFKRGETWKSQALTVPSSGTAGLPITFGAYGSGANPIFDPTSELNDFTLHADAIWKRTDTGNDPHQVFEDGVRMIYSADVAGMVAGSWCRVSGVLYVWCSDSGNPNTGHVIEYELIAQVRTIRFNGQSYLVFDGIDVTKSDLVAYNNDAVGSTNITVQNCTVSWSGSRSIVIGTDCTMTPTYGTDITINNVVGHDDLDLSFAVYYATRVIIENCTTYNSGKDVSPNGKLYPAAGGMHYPNGIVIGVGCVDCVIRHNYIHDIYTSAYIMCEGSAALSPRATGTIIERNHIDVNVGTDDAIRLEQHYAIIRNNWIDAGLGYGVRTNNDPTAPQILHNTVISDDGALPSIAVTTPATIKNNIIIRAGSTQRYIQVPIAAQAGAVIDNNLYYGSSTGRWFWGPTEYTTFATWKSNSSQDANGLNEDPVVVTQWTDLHLQSSSPCRNAGEDLDVADDYDGVARDDTPDIGAYEYVA